MEVEVIGDTSSLEIFINGGRVVHSRTCSAPATAMRSRSSRMAAMPRLPISGGTRSDPEGLSIAAGVSPIKLVGNVCRHIYNGEKTS